MVHSIIEALSALHCTADDICTKGDGGLTIAVK